MPSIVRAAASWWLIAWVAAIGGCEGARAWFGEPRADVAAPRRHASGGISFALPGDWSVRDGLARVEDTELRTIEVEGPGEAFLLIQSFEPAVAVDLDEQLGRTLDAMLARLGERADLGPGARGEVVKIHHTWLGAPRSGLRATIMAPGEWAPRLVELHAAPLPGRTLLVYTTIPEADRDRVQAGFDLVLDSLAVEAAP